MALVLRINHHGRHLYWTYERIQKEVAKYETLYDFRTKSSVAYLTASSKGFLKQVTLNLKRKTLQEKFFDKVKKTEICWKWTGAVTKVGYGALSAISYGECLAHRYSYSITKGEIPKGLVIDHLCRNRLCVNPDHLEAVTHKENILRGVGPCAQNAKKTKCANDHDYSYITPNTKYRRCRACDNLKRKALRAKKKGNKNGSR